jgi:hypothetical protein
MKLWIDSHLRRELENYNIISYQSTDDLQKLLSQLDFGLGNDSWIDDNSHIFRSLYYSDIFHCIQFLLAYLPFQAQLTFTLVHLTDSAIQRIYIEMNTAAWW